MRQTAFDVDVMMFLRGDVDGTKCEINRYEKCLDRQYFLSNVISIVFFLNPNRRLILKYQPIEQATALSKTTTIDAVVITAPARKMLRAEGYYRSYPLLSLCIVRLVCRSLSRPKI